MRGGPRGRRAARVIGPGVLLVVLSGCGGPRPAPPRPPPPAVLPEFTEVTTEAGIAFRHTTGASGQYWAVEAMGSGVGVFDYDGDGRFDIFLVDGGRLPGYDGPPPRSRLFRNDGDGRFAEVPDAAGLDVTTYGMGVCAGDYNNDGWVDVYVTGVERSQLFRNEGGRFAEVTVAAGVANAGEWGAPCAWFDYDRDGWLDLFVGNFLDYSLDEERAVRARVPDLKTTYFPGFYRPPPVVLYRNRGDGTFEDATAAAGLGELRVKALGVVVFDHDDDGWLDLAVANDGGPDLLLRNEGNGRFVNIGEAVSIAYDLGGSTRSGMGIDTGDFRNRGREAIAISNFARERLALYDGTDGRHFRDVARETGLAGPTNPYVGWGLRFLDFDLDGWLDLALVNGHVLAQVVPFLPGESFEMPGQLFRNEEGAGFVEVTARAAPGLATPGVGRGLAVLDFDDDGDPDLVMTMNGGPDNTGGARLLRNDQRAPRQWVGFRLMTGDPPRDALGARIRLTAGGLTQQRWVRSGASYLSESDPRALFGLGDAATVDAVEIRWPDGRTTHLTGLAAGRYYVVRAEDELPHAVPPGAPVLPLLRFAPADPASASDAPGAR